MVLRKRLDRASHANLLMMVGFKFIECVIFRSKMSLSRETRGVVGEVALPFLYYARVSREVPTYSGAAEGKGLDR